MARAAAPRLRTKKTAEERKWEAEDALRTLRRAEEIKRDSAMLKRVRTLAAREQQALKKIAGNK